MKKTMFLGIVCIMTTCLAVSTIQAKAQKKDEDAIKKVLQEETTNYFHKNYDGWANTWAGDLMLMYEIKNHAVLDGLDEKMEASEKKLFGGSQETQHTNAISRNDLRVLQGGKITQELDFK